MNKSTEWLIEHYRTIGSTGAGTVCGENPYMSRREYWQIMRAAHEGRVVETAMNDDMRRGILTEPLHLQLLEEAAGKEVVQHDQDEFIYHPAYPWAHTLPDGWIDWEGKTVPVQLKCPRARNWNRLRLEGIKGFWLLGCQHSIAVTDSEMEYFSVLNPETMQLLHYPVERDDELIVQLMDIEQHFFDLVRKGEEPEDDTDRPELPEIKGEMVTLYTEDAKEAAVALREARQLRKDAEDLEKLAKDRVKRLMGKAYVAQLPGLRAYQIQMPGRVTLDKKAMERDGIDISKYEKQGKPYITFRVYETED